MDVEKEGEMGKKGGSKGQERLAWEGMSPGERSFWLLRFASEGDHKKVARALAAGACPDAANSSRQTSLMLAIRARSVQSARALVRAGADLGRKDREGRTALALCAAGLPELVEELLEAGADASESGSMAFLEAVRGFEPGLFEALSRAGADPLAVNEKGEGALHAVALKNAFSSLGAERALALAKGAAEAGAALDEPDGAGWTPLHLAAAFGNESLARWLVERGADDSRRCGPVERPGMAYVAMAGLDAAGIARKAQEGSFASDAVESLAAWLEARKEARELEAAVARSRATGGRAL